MITKHDSDIQKAIEKTRNKHAGETSSILHKPLLEKKEAEGEAPKGRGGNFKNDVEELFQELNMLHLLMDKGYITNGGSVDVKNGADVKSINAFLKEELGINGLFENDDSIDEWVDGIIGQCGTMSNKYA